MEKVNGYKPLAMSAKKSILDVSQGSECVSTIHLWMIFRKLPPNFFNPSEQFALDTSVATLITKCLSTTPPATRVLIAIFLVFSYFFSYFLMNQAL